MTAARLENDAQKPGCERPHRHRRLNLAPWRGTFYPKNHPQKDELAFASRALNSIEINGTFYGAQKPASFAKWRDETPDDFVFALKGPRFATNRRVLAEAGPSIERFFASGVAALKHKLGPVNWQFAATKTFDPDDFGAFLALLPKSVEGHAIRHAVEVRHASFATPEFASLAREHGVAIVLAGDAKYPQIADLTAPFVYARLMGTTADAAAGYAPDALDAWAVLLIRLASGDVPDGLATVAPPERKSSPRDVFAYVIGGAKETNPAAARALLARLG
jgi:uncharacterized protein YecE (DUF72 family)